MHHHETFTSGRSETGRADYEVTREGSIAVHLPFSREWQDCIAYQCCLAGSAGRRPVGGEAHIFLSVRTVQMFAQGRVDRAGKGDRRRYRIHAASSSIPRIWAIHA